MGMRSGSWFAAVLVAVGLALVLPTGLPAHARPAGQQAARSAPASSVAEHTAPSRFSITPDIADHSCNGGHGAAFTAQPWSEPVVAAATLGDGATLTAFTQIYPGKAYAVLNFVTPHCTRGGDRFGNAGVARIRISPRLVPHPGEPDSNYLWINSISARRGGGAIVAGTYRGRWVAGAVRPNGRLDSTFGTQGWTALPLRGEVTAIRQEPSGRILLGGDNDGGGCCTVNHAAALTASGHLDRTFGEDGRVTLSDRRRLRSLIARTRTQR